MNIRALLPAVFLTLWPAALFAQDTALSPNFYLDLSYGFSTTKSKLLESNDTGSTFAYSLGGFVGDRSIEFKLGVENAATNYELNQSSSTINWMDTSIRYHYGWFSAGAIFSRVAMEANRAGTDLIDGEGSGYGGTLGMRAPVGRGGMVYFDVQMVSVAELKNSLGQEVGVPSRLDIDVGASVDLYGRWLDLFFGYQRRSLSIKMGSTYEELETVTYLGLKVTTTR